ncbi:MAG TPA: response regulator [Bryobacteraceae bacterium]|nr:response regulator [Bryobacteraceae bacterium]
MSATSSVLVIDPDPDLLLLISAVLRNSGIRVLRARSCAEAIDIARRDYVAIDMILSNGLVSDETGAEIVERVRRIRPQLAAAYMSGGSENDVLRLKLLKEEDSDFAGSAELPEVSSFLRSAMEGPKSKTAGKQS